MHSALKIKKNASNSRVVVPKQWLRTLRSLINSCVWCIYSQLWGFLSQDWFICMVKSLQKWNTKKAGNDSYKTQFEIWKAEWLGTHASGLRYKKQLEHVQKMLAMRSLTKQSLTKQSLKRIEHLLSILIHEKLSKVSKRAPSSTPVQSQ